MEKKYIYDTISIFLSREIIATADSKFTFYKAQTKKRKRKRKRERERERERERLMIRQHNYEFHVSVRRLGDKQISLVLLIKNDGAGI